MSNILFQIQYLKIFVILDLQEHIYRKLEKANYQSAGFAGKQIVGYGDLRIYINSPIKIGLWLSFGERSENSRLELEGWVFLASCFRAEVF